VRWRTVNPFEPLEDKHACRHGGAGIAGTHHGLCLAAFHEIKGDADRGILLAPHGVGCSIVHADHLAGVVNGYIKPLYIVLGKLLTKLFRITDQGDGYAEFTCCYDRTFNLDGRGIVASHRINSNSHGTPRQE